MAEVDEQRRTMAVVLTHNAPESLDRCLRAIAGQSEPPQGVLVVDNASDPPVRREILPDQLSDLTLIRSEVNGGPAGGYALALGEFLESSFEHAWVLDDDMLPDATCLERLWVAANKDRQPAYVFPVSFQGDGSFGFWPSWCGVLIAREIIEKVGVPMEELFWWAEDTEYLQWRIPDAGFPIRMVDDAVVRHDPIRHGDGVPVWKYYYEARNMLYVHLYVKRKVGRYPRNVAKLIGRAALRENDGRLVRLQAIAKGLWDGARGHLGIRFPVEPMTERTKSTNPPKAGSAT
jgi:rhamnopyranosyl-N-acetylglucosaminyl-diphospho-decaprenol beta-1,3/1,4-galactofuranosyltransferase